MEKQKVLLDISAKTVIKIIFICLLFVFLFIIRDVILVVLTSVVIASAVEPPALYLMKHHVRRTFAVIIIYLTLAILFLGLVYFFLPKLLNDLLSYLNLANDFANSIGLSSPGGEQTLSAASSFRDITSSTASFADLLSNINSAISNASEGVLQTIRLIFGGMVGFILVVVLSFYMAVKEDGIAEFLRIITPAKHEKYVIGLWRRSQQKIGLWMQGQLILGLIVAVLVYIGLLILGIEHALLLAFLAGVFELIPIFGPILSAIPAVLIAAGEKGVAWGLGVALLYLVIQQIENHFLYPMVVRKIIGISPIIVILAVVIGLKLGGILGVLLSVPISAALVEFFQDLEKGKHLEEASPTV